MGTETDQYYNHDHDHRAYLDGNWSCPDLPLNNQEAESEAASISGILNQDSISFGRYAAESLAWERWSVFTHNRCQEELEKFKNPGLVAQKKAYFEEYYKRIRPMKALQAEKQESIQPDDCQDAQSSNTQIETDANSIEPKEEENVNSIPISDSNTINNLNTSPGAPLEQLEQVAEGQKSYANEFNLKSSMKNKRSISLPIVKAKNSIKKASQLHKPSSSSFKTVQKSSHISSTVNRKENQLKKRTPALQAKATVASVRNKMKMESGGTMKNAVSPSESVNPTVHRKNINKADNRLLTSKKSDPKAASKINRKVTEVSPTTTVLKSLTGNKLLSSVSSLRTHQVKPSANSQGLVRKLPTRLPVHTQSTKVMSSSLSIRAPQLKPSTSSQGIARKLPLKLLVHTQSDKQRTSSPNIRAQKLKRSTSSQGLAEKLPSSLPVHAQSAKSISKDITVTGGLKNKALAKRSADLSTRSKSDQNIGVEIAWRSFVKGGEEKEEKLKENSALGRNLKATSTSGLQKDRKHVSSMVSNSPKAPDGKLVHKIARGRSVDQTYNRREPRQKIPIRWKGIKNIRGSFAM